MSDLSKFSTNNLKDMRRKLQTKRAEILPEYRAIGAELRSRVAIDKVKEHIAGLTDSDKTKLAQSLQADGIASTASVGDIGAT